MKKDEIKWAVEVMGLPPMVDRKDLKRRYRQLARRYHPDREGGEFEKMERLNRAYEILKEYMENFRFSFDDEELKRQYPGEYHSRKFGI